ncbi:MAG: discoidin domain-containing protein [Sedimentisphaerales bacterium]|nr:discoidin domain-containing protein [Sedimentisphaerales bacterium]
MKTERKLMALVCIIVITGAIGSAKADFTLGEPVNLGPLINSAAWDNASLLSQDVLCMYFQSGGGVYMATRDTKYDSWSTVVNLGVPTVVNDLCTILKPFPIMTGWMTGDGLEVYCGWNYDLWMMKRPAVGADWSAPLNIGSPVNTSWDEIWSTISSDGLELYFSGYRSGSAYVRPGGQGDADLWVTKRTTRNDPWGTPVNLGAIVNSSSQDARPYLSADGLALFFDSQRPGGCGSGDLYVTRRATRTSPWGLPMNLGPTVNSVFFDEGVSVSPDGSAIRWDCARLGGYGSNDIWQASITPIFDLNGDGKVDSGDMTTLVNNWGKSTSLCDIGPFAWGDGIVDEKDLAVLMEFTAGPAQCELDIPRDVILNWMSTPLAQAYDVYFGTSREAVEDANRDEPLGVLVSQDQLPTTYDPPGLLEFNQSYFWRIDVIDSSSESPIYKGLVLEFTTELSAYPIQNITAIASSYDRGKGPENTINSSGLTNDLHGTDTTTMWLSGTSGPTPAWIQYSFDTVYRIDQLWVWNYNYEFESMLGLGAKDITVQYSTDGNEWTTLGDFVLNQALGSDGYDHNTTISFGGITAQQVKIIINSSWSGQNRYGLSEVRFFYIPTCASRPQPKSGQTGVSVDTTLSWLASREASSHRVYFGTDEQAVADCTIPNSTVNQAAFDPGPLDLGMSYYWCVDEVNEVESSMIWPGDLWNFSTCDCLIVDNMESYDDAANTVFNTWIDALIDPAKGGSQIGKDYPPYMERTITHAGRQSMPFIYDNTTFSYSEATRTFEPAQDWTAGGIKTLVLYFRGDSTNAAGQLFVKINGMRVDYNGNQSDLTSSMWKQWNIDLKSINGVDPKAITTLTIGVSGTGKGMLYIDDISLYRLAPEVPQMTDPSLMAHFEFEGDVKDTFSQGYNGTTYNITFVDSLPDMGKAAQFDGYSSCVDLGPSFGGLINTLGSSTFAVWVNYTGFGDAWQRIFECSNGSATPTAYIYMTTRTANGFPKFCYTTKGSGSEVIAVASSALSVGWHHLAGVVDASTMKVALYVDGNLAQGNVATSILPNDLGTTSQNWLGRSQSSGGKYLHGEIDDFRVYNRVLTVEEIHYLAGNH